MWLGSLSKTIKVEVIKERSKKLNHIKIISAWQPDYLQSRIGDSLK